MSSRLLINLTTFFQNIPLKLLEENDLSISNSVREHPTTTLLTDRTYNSLNLDSMDVEKNIPKLKNKESAVIDKIPSNICKLMAKFFAKILTLIFNESIKNGIYPEILKKSIIFPKFKTGDPKNLTNYRPIHNLSVISKIFEGCIKEKILNYLEHIGFFAPTQLGFLRNKSTDMALFNHITGICNSIESNKISVSVYLDLYWS